MLDLDKYLLSLESSKTVIKDKKFYFYGPKDLDLIKPKRAYVDLNGRFVRDLVSRYGNMYTCEYLDSVHLFSMKMTYKTVNEFINLGSTLFKDPDELYVYEVPLEEIKKKVTIGYVQAYPDFWLGYVLPNIDKFRREYKHMWINSRGEFLKDKYFIARRVWMDEMIKLYTKFRGTPEIKWGDTPDAVAEWDNVWWSTISDSVEKIKREFDLSNVDFSSVFSLVKSFFKDSQVDAKCLNPKSEEDILECNARYGHNNTLTLLIPHVKFVVNCNEIGLEYSSVTKLTDVTKDATIY